MGRNYSAYYAERVRNRLARFRKSWATNWKEVPITKSEPVGCFRNNSTHVNFQVYDLEEDDARGREVGATHQVLVVTELKYAKLLKTRVWVEVEEIRGKILWERWENIRWIKAPPGL
jgi:hypothetical protein